MADCSENHLNLVILLHFLDVILFSLGKLLALSNSIQDEAVIIWETRSIDSNIFWSCQRRWRKKNSFRGLMSFSFYFTHIFLLHKNFTGTICIDQSFDLQAHYSEELALLYVVQDKFDIARQYSSACLNRFLKVKNCSYMFLHWFFSSFMKNLILFFFLPLSLNLIYRLICVLFII